MTVRAIAKKTAQKLIGVSFPLNCPSEVKELSIVPTRTEATIGAGFLTITGMIYLEASYIQASGNLRYGAAEEPFSILVTAAKCDCDCQARPVVQCQTIHHRLEENILQVNILIYLAVLLVKEEWITESRHHTAAEVKISRHRYVNRNSSVVTADTAAETLVESMAEYSQLTYCVINRSPLTGGRVWLEVSPNGAEWWPDTLEVLVGPGEQSILVPEHFMDSVRLGYRSVQTGQPAHLDIWFMAQA